AIFDNFLRPYASEYDFPSVYVDDQKDPQIALLHNHVMQIISGNPNANEFPELLNLLPNVAVIQHPKDDLWNEKIIDHFKEKVNWQHRTKFSSEDLDLNHIRSLKENIPQGYSVVKLTEEIIRKFNPHLVQQYEMFYGSIDNFIAKGFGFCALSESGELASLCTCANPMFNNEFEIDIVTDQNHRRKGLATITAAYLIEYSLLNGLVPHWDAANEISTNLALKLGYTKPEYYQAPLIINE
ncbi:MAG: GNAT family N-acetyltransferase, partial [Candidatus Thorarchaeota archaeon]